jgi:Zn-dependent protease with chaperone function
MNYKNLTFLILLLSFFNGFAQVYKPLDTADYLKRKDFLKITKEKNEILIKGFKSKYSGKVGNKLEKYYQEFYTEFEKDVKNKDYTFTSEFDKELNVILAELKKNNSQIPQNLKVLVAKDNMPNAFCLPDGTFIINMGLFSWMENRDQVAGVLSHEIAHNLQEHSLKMLLQQINDDTTDKEAVANIKTLSANKSKTAFDIFKNRVYKKGVEKRKQEMRADSLGYAIFKNSGFKKIEFINALNNLKDFDSISPRELKIETYKALFDLPNHPFKEKWMKNEDFSLYNYDFYKEKLDKDSLSSHPEMTKRIELLQKNFVELKTPEEALKPDKSFEDLQKIARMEILPNLYHSEDYGVGVYAIMQFLQDKEDEVYYKEWLGKVFAKIYEARKNYNLNRYLDRVDPKNQSKSYQQFLNFMWNLSMDDIKNIADFYNKKGTS